jgi:PEGA domain
MKSLKIILLLALPALCFSTRAFAKDHASEYQVGTFLGTARADDGSYSLAQCSGAGCSATGYRASHNQHQIETADGVYTLDSPVSVGGTILVGLLTPGGLSPTLHKGWFMDSLHEGQNVLFYPDCNKHHVCRFWLPNPDKVGSEIVTSGWFAPAVAKTNTATLCGTGKLSAAVAAQVCGQNFSSTSPIAPAASTSVPGSAPSANEEAKFLPTSVVSASTNPVPEPQGHSKANTDAVDSPQVTGPAFLNPTSQKVDALVKAGQASHVGVFTVPPAADMYIDGQKVGTTPAAIVLVRNGDKPRTVRVVKSGFEPIEKEIVPDGSTVHIEVFLQPKDSE